MRPIKFRAWDKELKRMWWNVQDAYDTLAFHCCEVETDECRHANFKSPSFGDVLDNDQYQVQEFTGLLDKNGKEIYEGDIVKYDGFKPFAIEWENNITRECHGWQIRNNECEVIGNIYENPDLLNP